MKHISLLSIFMLVSSMSIMTSCSQSSKLESLAKNHMESIFKEIAVNPSSVNISDVETVYSDDSLCIIHCNFSAKNNFGVDIKNNCEYIFINSNGKNYESYNMIDKGDKVFVTPDEYEKNKKGTIYETLPYNAGLRYLAAISVNGRGREAGNKDGNDVDIPVPTGTGSWELMAFEDEFGEKSSDKYLLLVGNGVFSNSATTNSEMRVIFYANKGSFAFKLIEYSSSVVKNDHFYTYRVKDSEGEVSEMNLYNDKSSGQMNIYSWSDNYDIMKNVLSKGGTITISVKEKTRYGTPDTYLFKLNVSGYDKAKAYL